MVEELLAAHKMCKKKKGYEGAGHESSGRGQACWPPWPQIYPELWTQTKNAGMADLL